MTNKLLPHSRKLTIVAQDPSVRVRNGKKSKILTAQVDVPAEFLSPGPSGYRVQVVDYVSDTRTLYMPLEIPVDKDPFFKVTDRTILSDPKFHAQNVFAIVMRTLARFEFALGRRLGWGVGPQIKVVPHAFADANAFYSDRHGGLLFGYFPGNTNMIFTCLSHDVIVHETTHALVDGFRGGYGRPTSLEQEAFHEGFADIVALLSVFSLPAVVALIIDLRGSNDVTGISNSAGLIDAKELTSDKLRQSALFGLAREMGQELSKLRGNALRLSATLKPSVAYLNTPEFQEPHRCGEILVAAVVNAFIEVWSNRLQGLGKVRHGRLDRSRVVEEGANAADYLLTMLIRALDYAPPIDLQFGDFLSALLTADVEIRPDDSKYQFRKILLRTFKRYGITPSSTEGEEEPGVWKPAEGTYRYERTHFESMQSSEVEVFRFMWENRKNLNIYEGANTYVLSVLPCLRIGPDGFALKETVAEYGQRLDLQGSQLKKFGIQAPSEMLPDTPLQLSGGGILIFDERGGLKFHIRSPFLNAEVQTRRLQYLWKRGFFERGWWGMSSRIALMHKRRAQSYLRK